MKKQYFFIFVIIVFYNVVFIIEDIIFSVINQIYINIEYIIIDGGSVDGIVGIIEKYVDRILYWVSEFDKGIYDVMNKGLKVVNGDWVIFMGSDDVFFNNKVIMLVIERIFIFDNIYYGNVIFKMFYKLYFISIKFVY